MQINTDVSKRSMALACIGVFFLLQGLVVLGTQLGNPDWDVLYGAIPRPIRSGLWAVCGAITLGFAWSRRWQWVSVVAAVVMPIERVISYLWSSIQFFIPGPPAGSLWSLLNAGRWAAIVALIVVIAGWVEWDRAGGEADEQ